MGRERQTGIEEEGYVNIEEKPPDKQGKETMNEKETLREREIDSEKQRKDKTTRTGI